MFTTTAYVQKNVVLASDNSLKKNNNGKKLYKYRKFQTIL